MDAVRELHRKLAKAQEASTAKKISERNCGDLLQKLADLDKVKLVHTTTGKEWLTPEQLDREIRDALTSTGGRLGITDLPAELGVAVEHIESRVDMMSKKDGIRVQGELLSDQYVQGVAQEVEESLAELGCIAVSDLVLRYNLPTEFMRESVLSRITTQHASKQNMIYTDAYATRVSARARGALRGCTLPVTLAQLAARHRLDADMLGTAVQKMVKDGTLHGKLQGSTFTPKVYEAARSGKIDDFYSANQYLPLSMAKSAGVTVKDWAKEKSIEGVVLNTAFVDVQLVEPVLASVTAAVDAGSWVDVAPLLPASLVAADARELLQNLRKKLPADTVALDHVAMSKRFINSLSKKFEEEAKAVAERLLSAPTAKPSSKKSAPAADEDEDDGGSKKKGKRGAKGKKGRADEDDDDGGANAASGESGVDSQKVIDLLCEDFPELPADVHDAVCGLVQPLLASMVAEAQKALQATVQKGRKNQFETAEKFVQEQYEKVVFGLKALEVKDLLGSPLQQHFLREAVAEPLHRLLALRWHELSGNAVEVTSANRRQVLDQIIGKDGASKAESLSRLLAAATGKKDAKDKEPSKAEKAPDKKTKKGRRKGDDSDEEPAAAAAPETLDAIYHAAADYCHIYCKKVDKKREKTMLQEAIADCKLKLKEITEAAQTVDALRAVREKASKDQQVCAAVLQLAMLQDGVPGLLFPADAWALKLVAKSLADEAVREEALKLCAVLTDGAAATPAAAAATPAAVATTAADDDYD